MPEDLDPLLGSLLDGMLQKDPYARFTLQQIREHGWFLKKHPKTEPAIRIPPLRGDENRDMTVIRYLESHHGYDYDDDDSHYFTEHDLHGTV